MEWEQVLSNPKDIATKISKKRKEAQLKRRFEFRRKIEQMQDEKRLNAYLSDYNDLLWDE